MYGFKEQEFIMVRLRLRVFYTDHFTHPVDRCKPARESSLGGTILNLVGQDIYLVTSAWTKCLSNDWMVALRRKYSIDK